MSFWLQFRSIQLFEFLPSFYESLTIRLQPDKLIISDSFEVTYLSDIYERHMTICLASVGTTGGTFVGFFIKNKGSRPSPQQKRIKRSAKMVGPRFLGPTWDGDFSRISRSRFLKLQQFWNFFFESWKESQMSNILRKCERERERMRVCVWVCECVCDRV